MNIVILHGWGHSAQMWEGFASKLHDHKVLVLDLPGFGKEKLVSSDWDIPDYAEWVIKELNNKKLKKVILIGHSFGGKIAAEIALKKPDLIDKLILIAAPILRRPSIEIKTKIAIYKLLRNIMPKSFRRNFFASEYQDANKNSLGEIFKKSVEYDRTNLITKLKIPTLIIWGDQDKMASISIAKEMDKLFPNSKLEMIKNAGHNLHLEETNIIYGFIKKFIDE